MSSRSADRRVSAAGRISYSDPKPMRVQVVANQDHRRAIRLVVVQEADEIVRPNLSNSRFVETHFAPVGQRLHEQEIVRRAIGFWFLDAAIVYYYHLVNTPLVNPQVDCQHSRSLNTDSLTHPGI